MAERDAGTIRRSCEWFLTGHGPSTPRGIFEKLTAATGPEVEADNYGTGELIEAFESDVAEMLGKEAAVFMPSGTMAQQIALRIWCDRLGRRTVAMHPLNHLDLLENFAYRRLHGIHGLAVLQPSQMERLISVDDLEKINEPPGVLMLELPQREIGGRLPEWDDLVSITEWARGRGAAVHMDGARLWECKPYYGRDYPEICALFDSVYVSFYKIIGGIAGAALAGPADVITEARSWRQQHGGQLVHMFPMLISARLGLDERLGRMDDYHEKALEIAGILRDRSDVEVVPDPPQTNMMHLYFRADGERLREAALDIAEEAGIWIGDRFQPSQIAAYQRMELTVGDATLALSGDEIADLFGRWLEAASTSYPHK